MKDISLINTRKRTSCRCELRAVFTTTLLSLLALQAAAWGNGESDTSDSSIYGNKLTRDWLYDGSAVSMKLMGCVWGFVKDAEDGACLERSSEDGTQYWYMMANCRRAQAVFGLYSGTSCSSSNFRETFITKEGVSEFIYYLSEYDNNNAFGYYVATDDAEEDGEANYDNLPMCEQYNGKYVGLGCTDDGYFALEYYNDAYCTNPTGSVYDNLRTLNRALKQYRSCATVHKSNNANDDDNGGLANVLMKTSDSCSSLDSDLCTDNNYMKSRRTHTTKTNRISSSVGLSAKTWLTKLKYVVAGMLLLASFVMFTGILFTNRRRRRALMQRKYRQSSKKRSKRDDRSSRSKSKTRDKSERTKSSSSRRSKSRHRDESEVDGGVLA
ncbi:hypothetical protein MPSEU_000216900 [Mayamaea pseudoterrestris]|nr:hypothetical protein MPSEU_000216900 [Mayamaea pseudoterrestris]